MADNLAQKKPLHKEYENFRVFLICGLFSFDSN
jgi:hypothetical protein